MAGNAILINGFFGFPQMGVAGAAVSTVFSKAVGLVLACITLKRKCSVHFSLKYLRPFPAETFRTLLGIALPSGTESLSYNISQTFILRFINLMGASVVSAKVYGSMLANVAYVYSIAVAEATQILLGYMIGARKDVYKRQGGGSAFSSSNEKTGHPNWMSCFCLERATRLELATSTLARWRSTR